MASCVTNKLQTISHKIRGATPVAGADFLAAFVANCFRGAFPPVDLRAVCFVRAIAQYYCTNAKNKKKCWGSSCSTKPSGDRFEQLGPLCASPGSRAAMKFTGQHVYSGVVVPLKKRRTCQTASTAYKASAVQVLV
jgi:hypothetical protein